MTRTLPRTSRALFGAGTLAAAILLAGAAALAQGGPPPGRGMQGRMGMMGDASHQADMEVFHALLEHRAEIQRTVTQRADGVETLTESDNPEVARLIQTHVNAMYGRVDEARPIHIRDPLFRAVFENAHKITMKQELTDKGVRVVETSDDPWVARLVQAHAEVVNLFVKNGRAEMMKNHDVPARPAR